MCRHSLEESEDAIELRSVVDRWNEGFTAGTILECRRGSPSLLGHRRDEFVVNPGSDEHAGRGRTVLTGIEVARDC